MAASFALAGRTLQDSSATEAAILCLNFVDQHLHNPDGSLRHRFRLGISGLPAHLDDYAAQIHASLEVFAATHNPRWLKRAVELQKLQDERFWDHEGAGYYSSAADNQDMLARLKEVYDGASSSGNSLALGNLYTLSRYTGNSSYLQQADALSKAMVRELGRMPSGHCAFLEAWEAGNTEATDVVLVGDPGEAGFESLKSWIVEQAPPLTLCLLKTPEWESQLNDLAPFTQTHQRVEGRATAYVCRNQACRLPVTEIEGIKRELAGQ
jgi:uncharacterized protein YyaL (SSP411 family)